MTALETTTMSLWQRQPVLAGVGCLEAGLALLFLLLPWIDGREILGQNVWHKPAKFALSIACFTLTLAWFWPELGRVPGAGSVAWIIAAAMIAEITLIATQSARGVRSHFNGDTAADSAVYAAMGIIIMASTLATGYLAAGLVARLWRERPDTVLPLALCGGLLLFLAGSLVGGLMSARGQHAVGVADGGPGVPFLNWSKEGGDLRAVHFLGLHALRVLPFGGWLADLCGARPPLPWAIGGTVGYAALFLWQASRAWRSLPAW